MQQQNDRHERTFVEEFRVRSEDVVAKVKELIREGNVRRITVKNEAGRTMFELPLTAVVIGGLLLPAAAALAGVAALVANLTLAVERQGPAGTTHEDNQEQRRDQESPAGEDEMRGDDRIA